MTSDPCLDTVERIQLIAAKLLATQPVGRGLCLVGGFRYRLLDASARASSDIDYPWEGDLPGKQQEIVEFLRRKLLPELKRQLGYDGDVRPGRSRSLRPCGSSNLPCTGPPTPVAASRSPSRSQPLPVSGTVFLTVSDDDREQDPGLPGPVVLSGTRRARYFFFQDALRPDAPARLSQKLRNLALSPAEAVEGIDRLTRNRTVYVRAIERLLDEQVDETPAANLRAAGGAAPIWDAVMLRLRDILAKAEGASS